MIRPALVVVLVIGMLAPALPAAAQMYRWVDDQGHAHYSEGLDSIPERFRANARRLLLQNAPAAAPVAPAPGASAETVIQFEAGKRIYVNARINDAANVRLILDTGADRTVIAPRALTAAGISLRAPAAATGQMRGATGTADVQAYDIQSLQVGNAKVGKMLVISHDADIADSDGLLGRDFLDQFKVTIDNGAGRVTLGPK
jgi:predicted aspartyl protease